MTIADEWLAILPRIASSKPIDIDQWLDFCGADATQVNAAVPHWDAQERRPPPSSKLWSRADEAVSYIGVRVDGEITNPAQAAFRLAAAAVERSVVPIIFSTISSTGFERYGFRVERLTGHSADAVEAIQDELKKFWGIAIMIDCSDIVDLE